MKSETDRKCELMRVGMLWRHQMRGTHGLGILLIMFCVMVETIPGVCLATELIRNGAFRGTVSSSDWATSGSFHADSRFGTCHLGSPGYAYLSNPNGSAGNNLIGEMSQQFTIPANATNTILSYWYSITTDDPGSVARDFLNITVRNSAGVYLANPGFYSNLNCTSGYRQTTYDLSAYRGQTLTLNFLGTTDGSLPTVFRIDDVSVIATTTPHVSGINPAQPIEDASRQWISILGTDFVPESTVTAYAGSNPWLISVDRTQYRNATQIDVWAGLTEARPDWSVVVKAPDGTVSNRFTFPVVAKATQLPDLVVSALSVNPASAGAGEQVTVTFTVLNQGNVAAPATTAKIRLASVTTVSDQDPLLIDVPVPVLVVGQPLTFSPSVTIPPGTVAGNYYVGVTANASGTVQESDRNNNLRVTPFTVTSSSPKPEVFWVDPPTPVASGTPQNVTITGRNFAANATVTFHGPDWNDAPATVVSPPTTTTITVSQTFATAGDWYVTVTNPTERMPVQSRDSGGTTSGQRHITVTASTFWITDGFDYPIGNRGYTNTCPPAGSLEAWSGLFPQPNDLYSFDEQKSHPRQDDSRHSSGSVASGGWYNIQDVGAYLGIYPPPPDRRAARYDGVHPGEDWRHGNPTEGEKVYAVANGVVVNITEAFPAKGAAYGGWIIIVLHSLPYDGGQYYSIYEHVTYGDNCTNDSGDIDPQKDENDPAFAVHRGDPVRRGQVIARIGKVTGFTPHLHFEIRKKDLDDLSKPGTLYQVGTRLGYYFDLKSDPATEPDTMTDTQVRNAYAQMRLVGIQDPSDFIDKHRPPQATPGVTNGSFYGGTVSYWSTNGSGIGTTQHTRGDDWWARLTTQLPVDLTQAIMTPEEPFDLAFDYQFQTPTGSLSVLLNSVPIATVSAPNSRSSNPSTYRVTVSDPSLLNQQNAVLCFRLEGETNSQVDLTHIATQTVAPSVYASAEEITAEGGTTQDFSVIYTANVALDVATLRTGNVLVTGPSGYSQSATFVSVDDNSNGSSRAATYRVAAPNGKWRSDDNGTYTLTMQVNQVSDTRGNYVPYGVCGNFTVSIPTAPIRDFAWQYLQPLPAVVYSEPHGSRVGGKIHVIPDGSTHYSFDPVSGNWTQFASLPGDGLFLGGTAVVNSKLYAIGFGSTPGTAIYDPVLDSWSPAAPMPTPRYEGAVVEAGGKIYAIGGQDGRGGFMGTVEVYDPVTNKWAACASMPTPRACVAAVTFNGLIYTIGGAGDDLSSQAAVEVYDPATDKWQPKFYIPAHSSSAAAVVVGGKIYLIGSFVDESNNWVSESIGEFVPNTDPAALRPYSWRILPSNLLTPRNNAVAVAIDGDIYVIGGEQSTVVEKGVSRQHFSIVGAISSVAGSAVTFTVTALTSTNAIDTGYNGTIHFSSTDVQAVLPTDVTLAGGVGTFTVTFGTAGCHTLTITDTLISSITGTSGITGGDAITVTPASATHLSVNVWSNPVANNTFSFVVAAMDQFNNTDTNYAGTVHFTSTDALAVLPADVTLTDGFGTFNATLATVGTQTLCAADSAVTGISGDASVTVIAGIPTSTALNVSANSGSVGQAITLTATIAVVPPNTGTPDAGTVVFMDVSTSLGSAPVSAGTATLITTSLPAGTHILTASYSGFGSGFADSRSGVGPNSIITTFAGNGSTTYGGDNGPATAATMYQPQGIAVDGNGNIYIADSYNNRIRRVDAVTGMITTVAGNGTAGFNGDGGAATAASLRLYTYNAPGTSVAVDANRSLLYIADTGNNCIRRVDLATGLISTVAGKNTYGFGGDGSAATAAMLAFPRGVTVDASGNIYIADTDNQRIRRVTLSSGLISTVAGNGYGFSGDGNDATTATFRNPLGVAVDSNGNIYIADSGNGRVRKVTFSTGKISTIAGNGNLGYGGDGVQATATSLNNPAGVVVDGSGNIFIADEYNYRIRKVTLSGEISTVAGNGTKGYGGDGGVATVALLDRPCGIAFDANGRLLISDYANNRIRKVDLSTNTISTIAGGLGDGGLAIAAAMQYAVRVSTDGNGNVFFSDQYANRVREIALPAGVITTTAGSGIPGFAGDNDLAKVASLYYPYGVAVDDSGNVFIADASNNCVRKVDPSTGLITTVAGNGTAGFRGDNGPATGASLSFPSDVAVDTTGHLYISDNGNHRIRRVDLSTMVITTVAGSDSSEIAGDGGLATEAWIGYPAAIALDTSGNLFIVDGCYRIRKVNLSTGIISTVAGNGSSGYEGDGGLATTAMLRDSQGVAVDASGNIFIADTNNNRVRVVNSATGVITTVAGNGTAAYGGDNGIASAAGINCPFDVAIDPQGSLIIADTGNKRIRKVQPGWLVTIAQATTSTLVSSSTNPSAYGKSVTFTATVTPVNGVDPTGAIQFQIDGSNVGSPVALNGGTATYTTSTLAMGSHSVVAVYSGDGNFTGSPSPTFNQSVDKTIPTITWTTPAPITYGTALSNMQLSATASVDGTFAYDPAPGTVLRAGDQLLSVTFTPTNTTDFTTATTTVTVSISPALLATSVTIGDRSYDGTVTAVITSRSLNGLVGTDDVRLTGGTATFVDKDAGTRKTVTVTGLKLTGADAGNYMVNPVDTVNANITPALLTVTADDKNRMYGDSNPIFTASYTGFQNGETLTTSGVTGELRLTCTASTASPAGNYTIVAGPGTLTAQNYNFSFFNGTLTVSTQPVVGSVTSSTPDGTYGVGDTIGITVSFSEDVTLAGGALNLTLDTGAVVSIAPFISANSATAIYAVTAGQYSTDLNVTGIVLASGATLTNTAGNGAKLTLPANNLATNKDIVVATASAWRFTIAVTNADKDNLEFGMQAGATSGYDAAIDNDSPAAPAPGMPDGGVYFFDGDGFLYQRDVRAIAVTDTWSLDVLANQQPVTLAWSAGAIPAGRQFVLREVNVTGATIPGTVIDMATATTRQVQAQTMKHYVINVGPVAAPQTVNLSLAQGWNLVSLPVEPANPAVDALLGSATRSQTTSGDVMRDGSRGAVYGGAVWRYVNNETGADHYETVTEMHAFVGYWVCVPKAVTIPLIGMPLAASQTLALQKGWNLIGTTADVGVLQSANVQGHAWWWDAVANEYNAFDPTSGTFTTGKGCWLYVKRPTDLEFGR